MSCNRDRIVIEPWPPEGVQGFPYHLKPVIDCLVQYGNAPRHNPRWRADPNGYYCELTKPIDFNLLAKKFDFPPSLILSKDGDYLTRANTMATIRGPRTGES